MTTAPQPGSSSVIRFGAYEADLRTGELRKHGLRIKLQDQPFQILAMLLERPGELVTREQIQQKLWPSDTFVDFDHSLNTAIRRLRDALSDSADNPRFIETLPRRGYRFLGQVDARPGTQSLEVAASGELAVQVEAAPSPTPGQLPIRSQLLLVAVLALVCVALALAAWRFWPRPTAIDSVAVLPFTNETKDPKLDYLADGIAESIISDLSQVPTLKVMSRNSAFHYRGSNINPAVVAHELGVRAVLLGNLRQAGDDLRLSIELVDTRDQRQLWGEEYGVKLSELADFQQDISTRASQMLRLRLSGEDRIRLARAGTRNSRAYDLYLRGAHLISKRTLDDINAGLSYFQQSVDQDPGYAKAYVGIAAAYGMLPFYGGMAPKEAYARSTAAVRRAKELDPDSADVLLQNGYQLNNQWDWRAAEKEIRGAIERMPNSSDAHHAYMFVLRAEGRTEEALREARLAAELDPLWPLAQKALVGATFWARHYDEALRLAQAPDHPYHQMIGMVYEQQGKYREAIGEFQEAVNQPGDFAGAASLARAYALAGNKRQAQSILKQLLQRRQTRYVPAYHIAIVYAGLGDTASVLRWLRIAYDEQDPFLPGADVND